MSDMGPQLGPASIARIAAQNKQVIRELLDCKNFALYIGGSLHGQIHEVAKDARGPVRNVAAHEPLMPWQKMDGYTKECEVKCNSYHLRSYKWAGGSMSWMYILDGIDHKANIEEVYLKEPGMLEKLKSIAIRNENRFCHG